MAGLHELREALIVATDSALCFILAFVLQDRSRALEGKSPPMEMWRTFIPLAVFLSEKAKTLNAPAFQGFWYRPPPHSRRRLLPLLMCAKNSKQIEAVVRQHLFDMDMTTFGRTNLPENSSKAPTPDSSNSGANDRNKYQNLKGRLVQDSRDLRECWIDGSRYLTCEDIQHSFPNTYAARSTKWVDPTLQLPAVVGQYRRAFQLPLHRNTTPLEGINFGRRFLEVWATGNGINYRSKLNEWI